MNKLKSINTALMLDEMKERDLRIKDKLYDASCALEKAKVIAFNFPSKYSLDEIHLDRAGELRFLRDRLKMHTELSILMDYILEIDKVVKSIEDEELYCGTSEEVTA